MMPNSMSASYRASLIGGESFSPPRLERGAGDDIIYLLFLLPPALALFDGVVVATVRDLGFAVSAQHCYEVRLVPGNAGFYHRNHLVQHVMPCELRTVGKEVGVIVVDGRSA